LKTALRANRPCVGPVNALLNDAHWSRKYKSAFPQRRLGFGIRFDIPKANVNRKNCSFVLWLGLAPNKLHQLFRQRNTTESDGEIMHTKALQARRDRSERPAASFVRPNFPSTDRRS
jgi:hypothetical protein